MGQTICATVQCVLSVLNRGDKCRYTSEVTIEDQAKVISRVSDSTLFEHLETTWEFAGGPTPDSCWLTFSIDFAFKSPLYGQLASVFFQEVRT